MSKKILVTIPYRNRESHLKEFIPHITKTLQHQDIDYTIVVVEQSSEKLFNRGLLCNIGFELYKDYCDYICIHDVDIIGENFDYSYEPIVTHLSARQKERDYKEFYPQCLGGVVLFPKEDFLKINGFSNEYWGWGAEDDDLRLRCDIMGVKVQRKQGKFYSLPHETIQWIDRPKKSPGYTQNTHKLKNFKNSDENKKKQITLNDGLSNLSNYFSIKNIAYHEEYIFVSAIV